MTRFSSAAFVLSLFIAAASATTAQELSALKDSCKFWPFASSSPDSGLHENIKGYSASALPHPEQEVFARMSISDDVRLDDQRKTIALSGLFFIKYHDKRLSISSTGDSCLKSAVADSLETTVCNGTAKLQRPYNYGSIRGKVWVPLIQNVKAVEGWHGEIGDQMMARIDGCTGTVYLRETVRFTASCPLNYKWYPFDFQICTILFWLRTYEGQKVTPVLSWHPRPGPPWVERFEHHGDDAGEHDKNFIRSGFVYRRDGNCTGCRKDLLMMSFMFERKQTSYMIQTILPSIMMVAISYGSLFIPPTEVPGRMTLTITSTLTLVSMSTGLFRSSPRTSYLKAIDVFLLVCFSFSVVVLVVFCSVIYLNGEEKAKKTDSAKPKTQMMPRSSQRALKLERHSRIVLPLLFSAFTLIFFATVYAFGASEVDKLDGYTVEPMAVKERSLTTVG